MAAEKPDLIIPVRMDLTKALADLQKLQGAEKNAGAEAKRTGDTGRKAGQDISHGMDRAAASTKSFGSEVAGLMKAQMALAAVKQLASKIGDTFRETTDYVIEQAKRFADLRKAMQEVAALKGETNTSKFAVGEATRAAQAGLTPREWTQFQKQFQSYAGARLEGPGAKLTADQAEQYRQKVAAFMKARGVNPAEGAELAGSLLEYSKGPQSVDGLMDKFGKTYQTLEKARTPVPELVPQLARVMAHGVDSAQAAQMLSMVAPASPHEKGVAVEAAFRSIDEMKQKGTGKDFGVLKGMTPMEAIQSFAKNINERRDKMIAGGKTDQEAEDEVRAQLAEKGITVDVREARGLVRGFGYQGVQLDGLEQFRRYSEDTPKNFTEEATAAHREGEQGREDQRQAESELAQAKLGTGIRVLSTPARRPRPSSPTRDGLSTCRRGCGLTSGFRCSAVRMTCEICRSASEPSRTQNASSARPTWREWGLHRSIGDSRAPSWSVCSRKSKRTPPTLPRTDRRRHSALRLRSLSPGWEGTDGPQQRRRGHRVARGVRYRLQLHPRRLRSELGP